MVDILNEVIELYRSFINMFLNDITVTDGVTIGWIIIAFMCLGFIATYFIGRLR